MPWPKRRNFRKAKVTNERQASKYRTALAVVALVSILLLAVWYLLPRSDVDENVVPEADFDSVTSNCKFRKLLAYMKPNRKQRQVMEQVNSNTTNVAKGMSAPVTGRRFNAF